ncbi:MAG: NosD domain-containing protein [Limisphaerales bacterium]
MLLMFSPAVLAANPTNAVPPLVVTLASGATAAGIQQALDSLPATGGEVVLPAGKIKVTSPIILRRAGQSLRGAGAATILYLANDANCPVIIMGQPVNQPRRVSHLRVSDLFIDGNRDHQQREVWRLQGEGSGIRNNGITVQNVSDSVVENVTTARCRSGGLVTTLNTRGVTVKNLESFDNEYDGLACFRTAHCTFTQLDLHGNAGGAGISLDGNFAHNVIDTATLSGNDLGIFMRWSHDNQFRNITIRDSHNYGVFMAENIGETSIGEPQTDCINNSFVNLSANQCGDAVFRVNDPACTNNVVTGAKFTNDIHGVLSLVLPGLLLMK